MKFAYLCCDFGVPVFGTGGSSVHLRETTKALRELGHAVKVFAPRLGGQGSAHQEDCHALPLDGFADEVVHQLKLEECAQPEHLVSEWRALLYSEHVQKSLLPILVAFQPVIIYERYSLFSYAGVELARQLQIPLVLEVNAPLRQEQAKYRQLVLKCTAEELERKVLNSADALIVVSKELEDYARQLGVSSQRITVLPNGVDPVRFNPAISGDAVRSGYDLNGKRVIGFVGSLKPWHDLDVETLTTSTWSTLSRNSL